MMHPNHLNNLIQTDADQRFEIAVANIADRQALWVATNANQWLTITAADNTPILPLWHQKELATHWLQQNGHTHQTQSIDLETFLYQTVPQLIADNIQTAIMPVPANNCVVCSPQVIAAELANYAYEAYGDEYELDYLQRKAPPTSKPKLP